MRVRLPFEGARLSQGTVLLGFDYEMNNVARLRMDGLAVVNIEGMQLAGGAKSIKTVGTLELRQQSPVRHQRNIRSIYSDDLFGYLEYESLE